MSAIVVEFLVRGKWREVGPRIEPGMPGGSMSTQPPTGSRQLFHFGWDDDVPGVWASKGGADFNLGPMRLTLPFAGMDRVADLRDEPCELTIWNPKFGEVDVRVRLV